MARVEGGFFQRGESTDNLMMDCERLQTGCRLEWFTPSEPARLIRLRTYFIDAYEVSNQDFATFLNSQGLETNACSDQTCFVVEESQIQMVDDVYEISEDEALMPVAGVTWYGADAYCSWRDARLPTEAEWEKAATWNVSAGVKTDFPWGNRFEGTSLNFCDANCSEPQAQADTNDGYGGVAPVGSYGAGRSPNGTFDMAGNVWEWVSDWYDPTYYATSPNVDPIGPSTGTERVVRGGSWFDTAFVTLSTVRFSSSPDNADKTIGFRCARTVDSP